MKIVMLGGLLWAMSSVAWTAEDAAALEKARALFPEFSQAVYSDEDQAREAYDALIALSPAVQQRLLVWLDEQFEEKAAAYAKAKSGDSFGMRGPSPAELREMKELQKQLGSMRTIADETKMKKVLKEDGWAVLRKLLSISRSSIRSLDDASGSAPDPAKARAVREQARQVGEFRYELRKKLNQPVTEVDEELDQVASQADQGDQAASIQAGRRAAAVLKKNERFKGEIPRNEYAGILELNHWRIAAGLAPLEIDPKLCDAARDHSKDMERLGFFAHQSPVKGKKEPWDRAKNFGTTARGENIAINDSTEAANQAWFFSPGHHKNMFKPDFSVIGLGIQGRHYTQLFR